MNPHHQAGQQIRGGSIIGIGFPGSFIVDGKGETKWKEGRSRGTWLGLLTKPPTGRRSEPTESLSHTLTSSTFIREDRRAEAAPLGASEAFTLSPELEYPSCYQDAEGEDGNRAPLPPTVGTGSHSQSVVPRPAVSVALGYLFAMLILRPRPRQTKSETLGGGGGGDNRVLSTSSPGGSAVQTDCWRCSACLLRETDNIVTCTTTGGP